MIRRYMRLADDALLSNPSDRHQPGARLNRYFELAEFCIHGKWPRAA
jgi:hypothetical protein